MNEISEAGGDTDPAVDGDELDDAGKMEAEVESENEEGEEDRRRRRKRAEPEPEADLVHFEKRLPWLVGNKTFRAWIKQHHPGIRSRTELTPEIVEQFDDYDMATARERAAQRSESRDHEVVSFSEIAFSDDSGCDWPAEFRSWAATKYRIYHKKDVTRATMVEWREYYDSRDRAHSAKAKIDFYYVGAEEWDAGADQWEREGHRDLQFIPNTKGRMGRTVAASG